MRKVIKYVGYTVGSIFLILVIIRVTRVKDNIDLPFTDDPSVIGVWKSVDFVGTPEDFTPNVRFSKVNLYLEQLEFKPQGKMGVSYRKWTNGVVCHLGDITASKYHIKSIQNTQYMFYQWKSGDYSYLRRAPKYYVLEKQP